MQDWELHRKFQSPVSSIYRPRTEKFSFYSDLSQASEEEFYTNLAKEWKCQATLPNTNPIVRRLKFMISNVFYVLGAIARNDRKQTPASRQQLVEFYNDTYTMLKWV